MKDKPNTTEQTNVPIIESSKAIQYKKTIIEQTDAIKEYVKLFEVYMAKDEIALRRLCDMMDKITGKIISINNDVNKQNEAIRQFIKTFNGYALSDQKALADIHDMMNELSISAEEVDAAHKKRIALLEEINRSCKELEQSHLEYAAKYKIKI